MTQQIRTEVLYHSLNLSRDYIFHAEKTIKHQKNSSCMKSILEPHMMYVGGAY